MLKNKKGITLIALVITIIVLLILASISLTTITGENGIFEKAKQAREQSEVAKDKEELQLGMADDYIDMWVTGDSNKYLDALENLMTTELDIQGIEKVKIKGTDSDTTININFFVEYNNNFYETYLNIKDSEIENFGPEDLANSLINNLTLSNKSKLKKEYTIMAELLKNPSEMQEKLGNPKAIIISDLDININNLEVLEGAIDIAMTFEYESEIYDLAIYADTETEMEAQVMLRPSILEQPVLTTVSTGNCSKYGLDRNGHLYALGAEGYAVNVNKIKNIENITFTKIAAGKRNVAALDSTGKIWGIGNNNENQFGLIDFEENTESPNILQELFYNAPEHAIILTEPVCITSEANHPLNGVTITDVDLSKDYRDNYGIALDNTGKVYYWGYFNGNQLFNQQVSETSYTGNLDVYVQKVNASANEYVNEPTCINTLPNSTLADVTITKISAGYGHSLFLDSEGKIWSFGRGGYGNFIRGNEGDRYDSQMPRCINNFGKYEENNTEYTSLEGVTFKDISAGYKTSMAIDSEGNIWSWGYEYGDKEYIEDRYNVYPTSYTTQNYTVQKLVSQPENESNIPICLSKKTDNPLYGVKAQRISAGATHSLILDTSGRVWGWGEYENRYRNGENYYESNIYLPELLGTENIEEIYNKTIIDISAGCDNSGMVDSNGKYYLYGYFVEPE